MPGSPSSIIAPYTETKAAIHSKLVSVDTVILTRERANRSISASHRGFFHWFDPSDGPVERRLILKLDFYILTYACVGFWTLYIDRGILQNAYVSGMKEDLQLFGNQFVQLNAVFHIGYATSMIPATLLITKLPAQIVIPAAMALWAIFTLLSYRVSSFSELAGYRFLVGFFEGPFFCSIHYVLGSWYRPDEIVRRSGIFYVSSGVGTMTTGLLAARIYKNLNGALGYAGWKWMYIVAASLTFPVAIWGFLTFPGTPSAGKRWNFTQEEFDLAIERMEACGRKEPQGIPFTFTSFKRFFGRWHWYILVPWNILWIMGCMASSQGALTLWLKSNKQYSTVEVNNYTAISPSLGIIWILAFSWLTDRFTIVLGTLEVSLSPLVYSWVNIICAGDAEERAFVISSMLAVGTAFSAWVPLLAWQTVEAPRYFKGFVMSLVMQPIYFAWTVLVYCMVRMGRKHHTIRNQHHGAPQASLF
ncbi:hypothetical protein IFR05_014410 [Cadophora sp. M221]|nr:hypothetical protein IFR05_014410 [Cadophora sp. M221]